MSRATAANCKLPARLYNSLSLGQPATQQIWISSYRDRDGGVLYLWKIWSDMRTLWRSDRQNISWWLRCRTWLLPTAELVQLCLQQRPITRWAEMLQLLEWRMFSFYPTSKWKHLTMNCKFRTATRFNKELLLVQNWIIQTQTIKNNDSTYSYSYFTN